MTTSGGLAEQHRASDASRPLLLVLSGSSGRLMTERAAVISELGIDAVPMAWFGALGLPATPRRVPLDLLAERVSSEVTRGRRVGLFGTSFGAEAALQVASLVPGVDLVVTQAPTSVRWQTSDQADGRPIDDAKWTWRGSPVPGVPYVVPPPGGFADAREWHEASLSACSDWSSYEIGAEGYAGRLLLTSGGDDRVWPSDWFARQIVDRRGRAGLDPELTTWLHEPAAGHQVLLPGETPAPPRPGLPRGGDSLADASLGQRLFDVLAAWP